MIHIRWAPLTRHFGRKALLKHCKTMFPLILDVSFWYVNGQITFFGGVLLWVVNIGRARHPGQRSFTPGQLSIEFANVGGWLTSGDLALDSCAQFFAVAELTVNPFSG